MPLIFKERCAGTKALRRMTAFVLSAETGPAFENLQGRFRRIERCRRARTGERKRTGGANRPSRLVARRRLGLFHGVCDFCFRQPPLVVGLYPLSRKSAAAWAS